MKSWLTKFRISAALDAGRPFPTKLNEEISRSGDLTRFAQRAVAVDSALKGERPWPELPPFLHQRIMHAVEGSRTGSLRTASPGTVVAWVVAPALAVAVLIGAWWRVQGWAKAKALEPAATALALGSKMPQTAAAKALAPLSDELQRVNRDLEQTKNFLLASLP
jgi:hypothetical protein